ncbi:hypothetical protein BV25DRAFT_1918775 [Artomyces pyxidatus]|uniref:Uncharacterized protein n=1 Tax=Artomyces pyxidatus TaxID=48021 RepID=A0ACB8SSY1_9AGAM|nr:hypothetical protein BV25DRAFT_1918775 [Artomyces pyxidatus]
MSTERAGSSDSESPGAFVLYFGKYKGRRLDSLDEGYIKWCIDPGRSDNPWYADFVERVEKFRLSQEDNEPLKPPLDRKIWFGRYAGKPYKELDEGYKQWCLHPDRRGSYLWYDDFVKLNDECEQWKVEHEAPRSPGAIIVWFGKYKGHPFSDIFNRPGYMRALLDKKCARYSWYPKLRDIVAQYKEWLKDHKKDYRPRRHSELIQHRGGALGPRDDVPDDDDDDDGLGPEEEDENYEADFEEEESAKFTSREASDDVENGEAGGDVRDDRVTPPRTPKKDSLAILKAARAKRKVGVRVSKQAPSGTDSNPGNLPDTSEEEDETVSPPKRGKTRRLRVDEAGDSDDDIPFGEFRARWLKEKSLDQTGDSGSGRPRKTPPRVSLRQRQERSDEEAALPTKRQTRPGSRRKA